MSEVDVLEAAVLAIQKVLLFPVSGELYLSDGDTLSAVVTTPGEYVGVTGTLTEGDTNGYDIESNSLKDRLPGRRCVRVNAAMSLRSSKLTVISIRIAINGVSVEKSTQSFNVSPNANSTVDVFTSAIIQINRDDTVSAMLTMKNNTGTISISNFNLSIR